MAGLLSAFIRPIKLIGNGLNVTTGLITTSNLIRPESLLWSSVRTKVRCYFPRPNEVRRVRRHGWATRMSTPNGRKIIMRRILKGRHVLSH